MKKNVLISAIMLLLIALVVLPVFAACGPATPPKAKDKIVIGISTSLTGPVADIRKAGFQPIYEMWVDEVNAKGGIMVKEYGKKLPIEMKIYDDKSDVGTMTKLLEKLILEDKVDFVFAPCGTDMLFAAAPICNKYGYILIGEEGGSRSLNKISDQLPYLFSTLNTDVQQMPVLADVFKELGIKTAAITFLSDLHGIEYSTTAASEFVKKGINVIWSKSHTFDIKDMSPLLKEAKAANVDAFCAFTYPGQNILLTSQAMELGFNPKAFFMSVGPYAPFFRDIFGPAMTGITGCGAWNEKSNTTSKEFSARYKARYKEDPNYWGGTIFYASLEILQQSIEKAGTLNQKTIRDIMAKDTFNTVMGSTKFSGIYYAEYPGNIGQYQKGVFEVVDPGAKRTAAPILKPEWPPPPPKK